MSFKKSTSKKSSKKQQPKEEWVDVARISLWTKESSNGNTFLSGVLEFEDERKLSIRIFRNANPKNDKSPAYFGFGQCPQSKASEWVDLEEDEDDEEEETGDGFAF